MGKETASVIILGLTLFVTNAIWFLHELLWHEGEHLTCRKLAQSAPKKPNKEGKCLHENN